MIGKKYLEIKKFEFSRKRREQKREAGQLMRDGTSGSRRSDEQIADLAWDHKTMKNKVGDQLD